MPDIGAREVEMDQENVWEFIKYALKTLRRVALAAFKATMAAASPVILLASVWYHFTSFGHFEKGVKRRGIVFCVSY